MYVWKIQNDRFLALKTWSQHSFTFESFHVGHPVELTEGIRRINYAMEKHVKKCLIIFLAFLILWEWQTAE